MAKTTDKMVSINPTPRSPLQVEKDPAYKVITDYSPGHYWPSAEEIIVKHKKSGTFWKAVYAVYEDDSDAGMDATWTQVFPRKVTTTVYDAK